MTFLDCLRECIGNTELIAEFNRLYGAHLGVDKRAPIERMVDEVTGHQAVTLDAAGYEDMGKFVGFVYEFVWVPLRRDDDRD